MFLSLSTPLSSSSSSLSTYTSMSSSSSTSSSISSSSPITTLSMKMKILDTLLRCMVMIIFVGAIGFYISCYLPYNQTALMTTYHKVLSSQNCHQLIQIAEEYAAAAAASKITTQAQTANAVDNETKVKTRATTITTTHTHRHASSSIDTNSTHTDIVSKDTNRAEYEVDFFDAILAESKRTRTRTSSTTEDTATDTVSAPPNHDGWLTERHSKYATTDFQLWSIPKATTFWNSKLSDKVLSLVAAQYSTVKEDLELRDLFIVKYTGGVTGQQDSLPLHTDGSMVSFNIALSESVEVESESEVKIKSEVDSEVDENSNNDKNNWFQKFGRVGIGGGKKKKQQQLQQQQQQRSVESSDVLPNPTSSSNFTNTYTGGGTWIPLLNRTIQLQQGDVLVHDSGILHAGAQTLSGKRYIIVGFVNLKSYSYQHNPFFSWSRHFGTTATCINVTTTTTIAPIITETTTNNSVNHNKIDGNMELVCPGTRVARRIAVQHYTQGLVQFDNNNIESVNDKNGSSKSSSYGGLPKSLVTYGVLVHVLLLLRVLVSILYPIIRSTGSNENKKIEKLN